MIELLAACLVPLVVASIMKKTEKHIERMNKVATEIDEP